MKNMKFWRTALVATLVLTVMLSVTGGTIAWFTDEVTSSGNKIEAGTLDVALLMDTGAGYTDISDNKDPIFGTAGLAQNNNASTLWEPGKTQVAYLAVKNQGSLALKYNVSLIVENVTKDLYKAMEYAITPDAKYGEVTAWAKNGNDVVEGAQYVSEYVQLLPGETHNFALSIHMKEEAGNEFQGGQVDFDMTINATQQTYENDSFGNQYDADAQNTVVVSNAADMKAALEDGKSVKLTSDVALTNDAVAVAAGTAAVIDLNGKTLSVENTEAKASAAINNKGTLTLKNGTVTYEGIGDPSFGYGTNTILNTGKLVIDGATIINTTDSGSSVAIDNAAGAELIINSGVIKSEKNAIRLCPFGSAAINATINGGTITGARAIQIQLPSNKPTDAPDINLTVNGGTLKGEGGLAIYSYSAGQSFENVDVVLNGGTYIGDVAFGGGNAKSTKENVEINGGTYAGSVGRYLDNDGWEEFDLENCDKAAVAKNTDDLNAAVASGVDQIFVSPGEYTFPSNVKAGMTIECEEGTVFDGQSNLNINGATVKGATFSNEDGYAVRGTINGTFKDCTFTSSEALRWCYTEAGETAVFENCVIKTDFRGVHFDAMNGDVTFRNCTIAGFNACGGEGTLSFENCTFVNDNSSYNGLNLYCNTNLTNCTFNYVSGKTNFIDMEGTGKTLKITNCVATLDGAAANISDFVGGSQLANNTLIIDGVTK